ncbi:Hypothetical predicted protein [Lecanosticta acicola]|uniref:Uncharacterized protein n=1 Tax=Lecanosticta acicola TaxID=111012 RepID=A0AAI8Z240_9PEZI|nr:Hypothetical predicted protein [Lecanosticta acicola]
MPRACANLFEHHMPSAQAEADLSAAERTQRDRGEEETNGKIGRLCRLYFQQTNNFRAQLAALNGQNRDLLRRLEPNHDANDEPLPGLQFYLQPLVHEVESLQAEKNSLSDRLEVLQSTQFSQYERWRIAWDDSSEDEFAQAASKSKTSSHVKSLNHGGKRSRKLRRQVQKLKRQAGQLSRQASKDAADAKALRRENQELRSQNLQVDQYTTQQAVILAETEARLLDCQTRISSLEAEMVSLKQQSNRTQAQKEMNDQGTVALPPTPASSDRMPVYDTCENPVKTSLELVKDRLGLLAEQLQHLSSCQVFGTGDAAPNTPIDAFGARK